MDTEADCLVEASTRFAELFDIYLNKLDIIVIKAHDIYLDNLDAHTSYRTLGIGRWVDEGRIYFDIVEYVDNEQDAIAMCIERGEKAYFDILAQKNIYIKDEK